MKRLRLILRYLTGNWWDAVPNACGLWCLQHRRTKDYLFDGNLLDRAEALMAASLRNQGY
jgi:hypothetical protein